MHIEMHAAVIHVKGDAAVIHAAVFHAKVMQMEFIRGGTW
jgi:hypothetical protein